MRFMPEGQFGSFEAAVVPGLFSWCIFMPFTHLPPSLPLLTAAPTQDEETIPVELRNLPEYKQLLELKRLKKQTLREIQDDKEGVRHAGYKVTTATHWQQISKPSA